LPRGGGPGPPARPSRGRAAAPRHEDGLVVRRRLRAGRPAPHQAGIALMDPLSPLLYGRRNVRKVLPAVIILTFVVMLVIVILSTLGGLRSSMLVYTLEFDEWSLVFPKKDTRIPKPLLEEIAKHPAVERLMDSRNCFVRVKTLIGPMPFNLRAGRREENDYMLARVGATIKEGRLP